MFSKVKLKSRAIGACLKKIGSNTQKISDIFNILSNFLITISFFPYETIEEIWNLYFLKKCNSRSIDACLKKIGTNCKALLWTCKSCAYLKFTTHRQFKRELVYLYITTWRSCREELLSGLTDYSIFSVAFYTPQFT